jgi:hypothetical protein
MDDIFEEARGRVCEGLIRQMLPRVNGSYTDRDEFFTLNPTRQDHHVGSFHININTGVWCDHSDSGKAGQKCEGGDFIDLIAKMNGISTIEAARLITGNTKNYSYQVAEKKQEEKKYEPVKTPIPETTECVNSLYEHVKGEFFVKKWGDPTGITKYKNIKGEIQFLVVRFERPKKEDEIKREKNDIMFYLTKEDKWKAGRHPDLKPFTLAGIDTIQGNKLPILIVEGEKKYKAASRALAGKLCVITWVGGCKAIKDSNWDELNELLKGSDRTVYYWPDADSQKDKNGNLIPVDSQPGMTAAFYVKSIITQTKILDVYRYKPIQDDPHGWDCADYYKEGGDLENFITEYAPQNQIDAKIDPFQIYRAFIDDYYQHDNLCQFTGWYWFYDQKNHYYKRVEKSDIACNLQHWLIDTGLLFQIGAKKETTEFISKTMSFITRHSNGYIVDNPFRDAAVSPLVHFANGAVEFTKEGTQWYDRAKYGEDMFRRQFPVACLDISVDYNNYKDVKPETDFPAFYYFVKDMIPKEYLTTLDAAGRQKCIDDTLRYFSEIIAYTISAVKQNEYVFGLYGNERTGKSFFISIIKKLIGANFCSERRIEDLDNRFALSGLWDKKVYIEPDLKTRQPLPEDFIKAYCGEQITTIEAKNKDQIDGVKMSLAMFFVSNYEFVVKGNEGINRRLMLVPFKNKIEKHDTRLLDKICGEYEHGQESGEMEGETFDERPGLIALALNGYDSYIENGAKLHIPAWVQKYMTDWEIDTNSTLQFIMDIFVEPKNSDSMERRDLYKRYTDWCNGESRKYLGKKNFLEEVRKTGLMREYRVNGSWYLQWAGYDETEKTEPVKPVEKPADQMNIPF